jgi:two-component system chemotaxis response regulator CheY
LRVGKPLIQVRHTTDSRLLVLTDGGGFCSVRVLEASTQYVLGAFNINIDPKHPFEFEISDGAVFAVNMAERAIERYSIDERGKTKVCDISVDHTDISAFAISMDETLVALGDSEGNCSVWDINGASALMEIKLSAAVSSLAFDDEGGYIAAADAHFAITIISLRGFDRGKLELHNAAITRLLFCGEYLFSADESGRIGVSSKASHKALQVITLEKGVITQMRRFKSDGVLISSMTGQLALLNLLNINHKPLIIDRLGDALTALTYDNGSGQLVLATLSGNILFFDLSEDKQIAGYLSAQSQEDESAFKIIIVDDSITMRKVIIGAIRHSFPSISMLEASNGEEALLLLEKHPDTKVMFLDWNMPTMSGEQVVRSIKEMKIYPHLQIIMATTEGSHSKVTQMLKMGVAGYLVKPFRQEAVIKITQKLYERLK